jgi:hypothetical protein
MVTRLKRQGREAQNYLPFTALDMNTWSYTATSQHVFMAALLNTGTTLYITQRSLLTSTNLMTTGQNVQKLLVECLHIHTLTVITPIGLNLIFAYFFKKKKIKVGFLRLTFCVRVSPPPPSTSEYLKQSL